MKCRVLVDFDGTITERDVTDMLLGRFALPEWLAIEDDWKAGRIGSRECMARQVDLLRVTPEDYDAAVDEMRLDPAFFDLVELCRGHDLDVTIVSDGLDRSISRVLANSGLDLPFRANRLEHAGGDRWRLAFPHSRGDCRTLSGNCKCQFAEARGGAPTIMIGDGRSDFCVAGRADYVFAKSALIGHCRVSGIAHTPIERIAEVVAAMTDMLAGERFVEQLRCA